MKKSAVVRLPVELNVDWAQQILDNHAHGSTVFSVEIISIDIGTTTRVRVVVDHDGPQSLPRRWFVKLPSLDWRAKSITALPRLLHTEVRFYQEIAPYIPINRPVSLAAHSKLGRGTTLVLTDVTESGANPGSPRDALTVAQASMVINQLGYLHAAFWNKAHIDPNYRWLSGPVRRIEDRLGTALAVPLMKRGLRKAGSLVPKSLHAPAIHYARNRKLAMKHLSSGPQTLVHHDCHPGNLFWTGSHPGFLDWQMIRIGEGISDVAYFLATAVNPETRRLYEGDLLGGYYQILSNNGVSDIELNSLLDRYRTHLVYPLEAMLVTLAVGGLMDSESNFELIRRTAAAVDDLDAFSSLPI